ncbi:MAG TPA: KOW motif-containing protein [Pyrinomonadaceae bacterium]|jgi:transcriptional antiterminator NusG
MSQDYDSSTARRRVYRLGDVVRIRTGAFASFTGRIEGINQSRLLLKVAVEIFGRQAPVKLSFKDVEQVGFTADH